MRQHGNSSSGRNSGSYRNEPASSLVSNGLGASAIRVIDCTRGIESRRREGSPAGAREKGREEFCREGKARKPAKREVDLLRLAGPLFPGQKGGQVDGRRHSCPAESIVPLLDPEDTSLSKIAARDALENARHFECPKLQKHFRAYLC